MTELKLKLDVPVLNAIIKDNPDFLTEISHAAAKQVIQSYGDNILKDKCFQEVKDKIDAANNYIKNETNKIAQEYLVSVGFNKTYFGYQLDEQLKNFIKKCVLEQINSAISQSCEEYIKNIKLHDIIDARFNAIMKDSIDSRINLLLRQSIKELLK